MPLVVGVTFRRVGKVYYFDPGRLTLHEGDFVIAETARGVEFGEVMLEPREVPDDELVAPLKKVVRVATGDDLEREAANRERERSAFEVCERKIAEHGLAMKLLEAECAFDGSQITFSFSAEGRIDFRELVKDVAGALKTKVQLHQIGVRDEAKLVGGYGSCGRSLCCATFLSNFEPISMRMAKDQSLFLNPAKFSGCCGKLMCCLRYEHEHYKESQKRLPAVGAVLEFQEGRARVVDVNVISNMLTLETEGEVQIHVKASQLKLEGICRKHGVACNMSEKNCQVLIADPNVELPPMPDDDEVEEDEDIILEDESTVSPRPPRSQSTPASRDRRPRGDSGPNQQNVKGVTFREPGSTDTKRPQTQAPRQSGAGDRGQRNGDPSQPPADKRRGRDSRPRGRAGNGGNRDPKRDSTGES